MAYDQETLDYLNQSSGATSAPTPVSDSKYDAETQAYLNGVAAPVEGTNSRPWGTAITDTAKAFGAGTHQGVGDAIGYLIETAGEKFGSKDLAEYGGDMRKLQQSVGKEYIDSMSPEGKAMLEKSMFDGFKPNLDDQFLGALVMKATQSIPGMIVTAPVGGMAAAGISKLGGALLPEVAGALISGAATPAGKTLLESVKRVGLNRALADRALSLAPSAIGFGGAEGALAGLQNAAQLRSEIEQMPIEALREKSPTFREYVEKNGGDEEAARTQLAKDAAGDVALQTTISTGSIGILTGGGALGMASRTAKNEAAQKGIGAFSKQVAKGGAEEFVQEFPQSGGEAYIENLAKQKYVDPSIDPTTGVLSQAMEGGLIGFATGGVIGGAGHVLSPTRKILEAPNINAAIDAAQASLDAPMDEAVLLQATAAANSAIDGYETLRVLGQQADAEVRATLINDASLPIIGQEQQPATAAEPLILPPARITPNVRALADRLGNVPVEQHDLFLRGLHPQTRAAVEQVMRENAIGAGDAGLIVPGQNIAGQGQAGIEAARAMEQTSSVQPGALPTNNISAAPLDAHDRRTAEGLVRSYNDGSTVIPHPTVPGKFAVQRPTNEQRAEVAQGERLTTNATTQAAANLAQVQSEEGTVGEAASQGPNFSTYTDKHLKDLVKLKSIHAQAAKAELARRTAASTSALSAQQQATQEALDAENLAAQSSEQRDAPPPAQHRTVAQLPMIGRQTLSRPSAFGLQAIGRITGTTIRFFHNPNQGGGKFFRDKSGEVWINTAQGHVSPMAVFGHEVTHQLRTKHADAWKVVESVLLKHMTQDHLNKMFGDYFSDPSHAAKMEAFATAEDKAAFMAQAPSAIGYESQHATIRDLMIDEMMSDLGGNRFNEEAFWTEVFGNIEKQYGTDKAKGIIQRLADAITKLVTALKRMMGSEGFAIDAEFKAEQLDEIRTALAGAYAKLIQAHRASGEKISGDLDVSYSQVEQERAKLEAMRKSVKTEEPIQELDTDGNTEVGTGFADVAESTPRKPGSDIGHKREATSGRYVGAPDWIGSSAAQLGILRKMLHQFAIEGEPGRMWYENSSKAVLDLVNGNKDEAEKVVQLIAIYSPSNAVPGNTTMAVRAYLQWKQGRPIRVGTTNNDRKANELLYEGKEWSGVKTNSFYQNLMAEIDPSKNDAGAATMDMWMSLAFDYGMLSVDQGPKYHFMEREIQKLARELKWTPHQVQAAIWTAMKGRIDPIRGDITAQELDNGWHDAEVQEWWKENRADFFKRKEQYAKDKAAGKDVVPPTIKAAGVGTLKKEFKRAHYKLAAKMGREYDLKRSDIEKSKYDFSDAIKQRTAQLSWEATPGVTTGVLPGIHDAPMSQKIEYLNAIETGLTDADGNDIIGLEIGLALADSVQGFSGWQGLSSVGIQDGMVIPPNSHEGGVVQQEGRRALSLAAAVRGLVLNQEGVAWHYPIRTGNKSALNGVQVTIGRTLTEKENDALYKALQRELGNDLSPPIPTSDGTGFRVLNFTGEKFALMDDFGSDADLLGDTGSGIKKKLQKSEGGKNDAFYDAVGRAVASIASVKNDVVDNARFESDGELVENDWRKGDEDYRKRIDELVAQFGPRSWAGRPDIHGWIDNVLRPKVDAINRQFAAKYGWDQGQGALFSERRSNDAGRDVTGGGVAGQVKASERRGAISGEGIHYSAQQRATLSSSAFGTGLKGAELERVQNAKDPRIKHRIYFYLNVGRGINPEAGVGAHAHSAKLSNIYDMQADTLDLAIGRDANDFESAVIDAGFDGYADMDRGIAILLGQRAQPVEYRGMTRPEVGQAGRAPRSDYGKLQDAIAANNSLPMGQMKGADWKRLMPKLMPEVDVSHLEDGKDYYKSQVQKRPEAVSMSESRSPWYYSRLERLAGTIPPKASSAAGIADWLKAAAGKAGLKEEMEWSGVLDWLKTRGKEKVSVEEVQSYLQNNGVQVTETMLADKAPGWFVRDNLTREVVAKNFDTQREAEDWAEDNGYGDVATIEQNDETRGNTKFESYQLPGGENYRELLLTLPTKTKTLDDETARRLGADKGWAVDDMQFRSSHFDQPNILAHIRFNERTDAEGRRVLFIEEIQSDFGQTFRKQRDAITKAVDEGFENIVEIMNKAGVLEVNCD